MTSGPASPTATTRRTWTASPTAGARSSRRRPRAAAPSRSPCYRARYWPDQPAQISQGQTLGHLPAGPDHLGPPDVEPRRSAEPGQVHSERRRPGFDILRGDYTIPNANIPTCASAPGAATCTYQDNVTFDFSDQIQPRVGVAFVINKNVGDKIYANYGRYSNMDNQSFARSAAPLRPFRVDAFFNRTTGALITSIIRANQTGKRVLENIDPTNTDEFSEVTRGRSPAAGRPRSGACTARPTTSSRTSRRQPRDRLRRSATATSRAIASTAAGRIEVRKALTDNWSLDVSYTLSELKGNWDLDYATQLFYTSSYIEDGPGLYVEDPNRTGTLTGDRTHVGKIFGNLPSSRPTRTSAAYFRVPERAALRGPRVRRPLRNGLPVPRAGGLAPDGGLGQPRLLSRAVVPGRARGAERGGEHLQHLQQPAGSHGPAGRLPRGSVHGHSRGRRPQSQPELRTPDALCAAAARVSFRDV